MKRIASVLLLSVLASLLSSCYSPKPFFAVADRPFHRGFHGGDQGWDPPADKAIGYGGGPRHWAEYPGRANLSPQ